MRKSGLKNAAVFAAAFILAFVCSGSALALDATSFDPRNVAVEANAISGVPVGTIITWPVATNPEGWDEGKWLECNGQTISQAVYPVLFALTGGTVPDLRGLFLRGYGSQQYNSGGYGVVFHTSGALGQIQGDAIRNITGEIKGGTVEDYSSTSGVFELTTLYQGSDGHYSDHGLKLDASRIVPTAAENRPINRAVRYLIRAQP